MKFSDGEWLMQPGVSAHYPVEVHDVTATDDMLVIHAATRPVRHRGDTLGGPLLTIRLASPMDDVISVGIEHFVGAVDRNPRIPLQPQDAPRISIANGKQEAVLRSGRLGVHVRKEGWEVAFKAAGRLLTKSAAQGMGCLEYAGRGAFVHERLQLGVGECVYGLGERFTAFVKNGQVVENENRDGGTGSDQAYKSVPFYLTNRGYGVLVNTTGPVSFEVASERVSRAQFSRAGREAGIFPHLRPAAQGHPAQAHAADRPAGAAPRVVVRPVAEHLVHDRLRREDLHPVHRGHEGAAAAAACLPLRLLLDARVQLVRF